MLYGFSRDQAVPFWRIWTHVDAHSGVPVNAGLQARSGHSSHNSWHTMRIMQMHENLRASGKNRKCISATSVFASQMDNNLLTAIISWPYRGF